MSRSLGGQSRVYQPVATTPVGQTSRILAPVTDPSVMTVGPWLSFIPTLSGGFALGNATYDAKYARAGRTIFFYANISTGSSSSYGSGCNMAIPVAARATLTGMFIATATSGFYSIPCLATLSTTTTLLLNAMAVDTTNDNVYERSITTTVPFTWAAGSRIIVSGTYEAAS